MTSIMNINNMLPSTYSSGPHYPRIILEYDLVDAFIVSREALSEGFISMLLLTDPIAPNGAQHFLNDLRANKIDFSKLRFKMIGNLGELVKDNVPHDLIWNNGL